MPESPIQLRLRQLLFERNISQRTLAKRLQVSQSSLSLTFSGRQLCPRQRRKVESFLGVAIWVTPEIFKHQNQWAQKYGIDPAAVTRTELRQYARSLGVKRVYTLAYGDLIEAIVIRITENRRSDRRLEAPTA